jgi:general secretion pathway protein A
LSLLESYSCITHRLSVAGLDNPTIFSKRALDVIVKATDGVPRVLNVLCNNALLAGFRREKNPVTASIAKEIVTEYTAKERRPPVRKWKAAALVGSLAVFLALVIAFFLSPYRQGLVEMLPDFGFWQVTRPEPVRAAVSQPKPTEQMPVAPVLTLAPPSEPKGAVEPTTAPGPRVAAIKPDRATPPKHSPALQPAGAEGTYKTRVVKPGDTLSGLISEVYGLTPKSAVQPPLIDLVKQHNPAIKDSNVIVAGSEIRFPELPNKK